MTLEMIAGFSAAEASAVLFALALAGVLLLVVRQNARDYLDLIADLKHPAREQER